MYLWFRSMSFVFSSKISMGRKPVLTLTCSLRANVFPESAMIWSIFVRGGTCISFALS